MTIKRYNSASLSNFKKKLIEIKGGDLQEKLLKHTIDSDNHEFVLWLDNQIGYYGKGGTTPIEGDSEVTLPSSFSAREFMSPEIKTKQNWFSAWKDLQVNDAANSSVWAYIVRQMIAKKLIRPCDLMFSSKGSTTDGNTNIRTALNAKPPERAQKMDKCVRDFIRHLCGFYEERGARSLYQDCPFARAWWQHHIAESVKNTNTDDIIDLFHKSIVWTNLSDKITTRLTILGDKNIRNGIIMFLANKDNYHYHKEDSLQDLLISVGIMTTWCALGYFPPEQVQIHVAEIAQSIEKKPLGKSTAPEDKLSEEDE